MSEIAPDMKLRISVELRKKIEDAANRNGRTLNGEINIRLEASFAHDPIDEKVKAHDRELARLRKRLDQLERLVTNGIASAELDDDD